jgi:NAD(P)-dependent dehydrogenase (short-subunit alcohol dehydrogenase family)
VSVWVVTGANRGIGLELCRQLAARGDQVFATAREPARATELRGLGVKVQALELRDQASVDAFGKALDGVAVDVLVNNAGRGGAGPGIDELDWDIVADYFWVNAIGTMRVVQALLPAMRRGRAKKIIQLSTAMASIADNHSGGSYAYRSSKAALNMLNRSLAYELLPEGFTCLAMNPGWVQTDMGGPNARLTVAESVTGMLRVIDRTGPGETGKFVSHAGTELAW